MFRNLVFRVPSCNASTVSGLAPICSRIYDVAAAHCDVFLVTSNVQRQVPFVSADLLIIAEW